MLIAYGSDLHLEFSIHKGFDYKCWDRHADVLILAGDILSVDWYKKAINQNSGDYNTSFYLKNGKLYGSTHSLKKDFLAVWEAVKE